MNKIKQNKDNKIIPTPDKKPYIRPRNISLSIKITQEERDMIERRMEQSGMSILRAFIVKMAIDGRVIHVELESVQEMVRLLSNVSNNINQIAHRVNSTNNIYAKDVDALRDYVDELWGQTRAILQKLSKL